jgi:hypothetical protein
MKNQPYTVEEAELIADLRRQLEKARDDIERLRAAGSHMAILCFNLSQPMVRWNEKYRKTMDDLHSEWMQACRRLN